MVITTVSPEENLLMLQRINLLLLIAILIFSQDLSAEPYLAYMKNMKCSACHVNPDGGGLRNEFGNIFGHALLPGRTSSATTANIGKLNDYFQLGGNFRSNIEYVKDDAENKSATFEINSAQLYLALNIEEMGLTFYLDQKIAPGSALNREAFVMYKFAANSFVKIGKMYTPFGIRLEDDSALIRQVTGFNFDSSDNGIELGYEYNNSLVNFFISNGTSAVNNDDNDFLYGVRGEYLFTNARIGSTLVLNDRNEGQQKIVNIYGGYTWGTVALLTEWDWIENEQLNSANIEQLVGLLEIDYQWMQGLNFKLSAEYYDPNLNIDEDHETRFSFIAEYTPLSHVQLRAGVRIADSIPQFEHRNNDTFFIQTHFYF